MRRAGRWSVFLRVLTIVVAAGLVSLVLATAAMVRVVREHVEAALVETAVARAERLRDDVDHRIAIARSELRAVGIAAASGQVLEVPSIVTGPLTAVRSVRDEEEILDAAATREAHQRLRQHRPPPPGEVALSEEGELLLSVETAGVLTHALHDLEPALAMPEGWSARLVGAAESDEDAPASRDLRAQIEAGAVLAERGTDGSGEERVLARAQTQSGVGVVVTAPLAPARRDAYRIIWSILLWSSLSLVPLLLLALVLGRAVTKPVRLLARAVRESRDEPVKLPRLPADEIGDLGGAIGTMSSRLHADARALRTAVIFARRVSVMSEPEEVLAALGRALREALPEAEWFVVSAAAIADGAAPDGIGLGQRELEEALIGAAVTEIPDELMAALAADESGRLSGIEVPVARFAEERRIRVQMVLRHQEETYGLVVGRGKTDEAVSLRHAELLSRAAVATLRNLGLLKAKLANEKLAVLGRLSAEVTHEMSNPLAFVLANLRTLETELEGDARDAVAESRAGAERLERIVRDLSSLARGGIRMDLEDLDLAEVAREAARVADSQQGRARIEVDARESVPIYADAVRVEQVLVNLLANAVDAALAGSSEAPQVVVRVRGEEGIAIAEVRDNGPGISASARKHLFEAFYTTKGTGGTGLGLFLSKSLAEAQGGDLSLDSTGPTGTCFTLTLPLSEKPVGRRSNLTPQTFVSRQGREGDGGPLRILVLDDESSLVRALSRWLRRWAEVDGTTDPEEALALAERGVYTMILCDLNMPSMAGTDFIAALSDRSPEAAARVVIMTGSGTVEIPGVPVVSKPIQPAVIEELLNLRRRERG